MITGKKITSTTVSCKVINPKKNHLSDPQQMHPTQYQTYQVSNPISQKGLQFNLNMFEEPQPTQNQQKQRHLRDNHYFQSSLNQVERQILDNKRSVNFCDQFAQKQGNQRQYAHTRAMGEFVTNKASNDRKVTQYFVSSQAKPTKIHKQQIAKNDRLSAIFPTQSQKTFEDTKNSKPVMPQNDKRALNKLKTSSSSQKDIQSKRQQKKSQKQQKQFDKVEQGSEKESTFERAKIIAMERIRAKKAQQSKKATQTANKPVKYKAPLPTRTIKSDKPLYKSVKQEIHDKLMERQRRRENEEQQKKQMEIKFQKARQQKAQGGEESHHLSGNEFEFPNPNRHQQVGESSEDLDGQDQLQERMDIPVPISGESLGIKPQKLQNKDIQSSEVQNNNYDEENMSNIDISEHSSSEQCGQVQQYIHCCEEPENHEVQLKQETIETPNIAIGEQTNANKANLVNYPQSQVSFNEFLPENNQIVGSERLIRQNSGVVQQLEMEKLQDNKREIFQRSKIVELVQIDIDLGLNGENVDDSDILGQLMMSMVDQEGKHEDHRAILAQKNPQVRLLKYHESSSQEQSQYIPDIYRPLQSQNDQLFKNTQVNVNPKKPTIKKKLNPTINNSKNAHIDTGIKQASSSASQMSACQSSEQQDEDQNPRLQEYLQKNNLIIKSDQAEIKVHGSSQGFSEATQQRCTKSVWEYRVNSVIEERDEQYFQNSQIDVSVSIMNSRLVIDRTQNPLIQDSSSSQSQSDEDQDSQRGMRVNSDEKAIGCQSIGNRVVMGSMSEELFELGVNDLLRREYIKID